jgi:hypothetical protein
MLDYHKNEEYKYEAERDVAFHAIMDLTRDLLTSEQQSKLIELYVDATHASYWAGWHGHGYAIEKVETKRKVSA